MQNLIRFSVATIRQIFAYCSFYRHHGDGQVLLLALIFFLLGIPAAIIFDLILLPHRVMLKNSAAAAGPKSGERWEA